MSLPGHPGTRLPSGTVTLLRGHRGLDAAPELAPRRLRAGTRPGLRELVREAASTHDGGEVDWAGDGVFLAFARAREAVLAATQIQRALEQEAWPPDGVVRLRIGIHTGEPDLGEEGYIGMDVVVASRICAAAHGGQVVVSRSTRDVVADADPASRFARWGATG